MHVQGMVDFLDGTPPRVTLELQTLAGVHLARIDSSPIRLVTPSAEDGVVYFSITAAGGGQIDASGHSRTVRAGDFNVMQRDRRCTTIVSERSDILSIAIPRTQIVPRLASEDNLRRPILHSRPAAHLLHYYAATLIAEGAEFSASDQAVFAGHIADLAVMALGARSEDAELAGKGGVRAARRRAIKADIAANLGMPELTLDWIARRQTVSGAYVRALFADEGTSFTDYVLAERLNHVHALLVSPYLSHHNIASLALMAGFGDISWFNQAFRRRFGTTPSEVRQARRTRHGQMNGPSSANP
ncbi:AraC family transcriptional regulator [Sphingomonas sp. M1-B02]|uniref:AraC family transcriptional regulator n=1 Tax=Sphingomonas sp. M1-B02 TaxID=3114300 RepID=UPI002240921B|nr:AraC family transcriptional regulator [Sphingomonas sp. S6-11]UZK65360.1 AraC family transcriptional regulator [Sphingomonas sp. S6-11]